MEVEQREGEREDVGLRETEEEAVTTAVAEGGAVALAVLKDVDVGVAGDDGEAAGLPVALDEKDATESCEGLCARVEVGQREGKGDDVGL